MSLRESINRSSAVVGVITVLVLAGGAYMIHRHMTYVPPTSPAQAYFTLDDGQTYFGDAMYRIPPFDKDGREAVKAYLFSCDGGQSAFVAYLEKYSPQAREHIAQVLATPEKDLSDALEGVRLHQILVKKPGEGDWIGRHDPRAAAVTHVRCPDGNAARAVVNR